MSRLGEPRFIGVVLTVVINFITARACRPVDLGPSALASLQLLLQHVASSIIMLVILLPLLIIISSSVGAVYFRGAERR